MANYKPPADAKLVLPLRFKVHNYNKNSYYAEAVLEVETRKGFDYYTVDFSAKTYRAAFRGLISKIENSTWFWFMHDRGVRFKVSGERTYTLYKGYL